jgi:hypothetical protein
MLNGRAVGDWKNLPGMWRLISLKGTVHDSLLHATTFRWPMYDLRYYFNNLEAQKLYRLQSSELSLNILQQRVVGELKEKGISVMDVIDLLPDGVFKGLQESAEALIQKPENQRAIKELYCATGGVRSKENLYLIYLLEDKPVLSLQNQFLVFSLRNEILRIVCGYLGMFCRLLSLNAWCNVPMTGPDRFSQRWHRDPDDKKLLKLFLYLRDVDETTGPFCYIPGSHNGGPFKKIHPQTIDVSNYPSDGVIEKAFPHNHRLVCVGKAGTLIFCDTTGFHKGGHPTKDFRLLFNAVYMTNAGALLHEKRFGRAYSIADWTGEPFGSLGKYAVSLQRTSNELGTT